MIVIDLPADLHQEDDDGLNIANRSEARSPDRVVANAVLVAGKPQGWSWVRVQEVDEDGMVHFTQITMREAAEQASLVETVPA